MVRIAPKPGVMEILAAGREAGEPLAVTLARVRRAYPALTEAAMDAEIKAYIRALVGLAKGTEVYAEGRLSLNAWTSRDGAERTGLSVVAWRIEILGQIGSRPGRSKARREGAEADAFNDAIPF